MKPIDQRKILGGILFIAIAIGFATLATADPSNPPPPPPNDEPSSTWTGNTTIQGCFANFDSSSNTLDYCNQPYIQYKTKAIYFCDANGNRQYDSYEKKGSYSNPEPNCASGTTYVKLKSETRKFATCGKEDGESASYDSTPKETNVNENTWSCPSAKALSLRHEPGNLDPGLSLSAEGYTDVDSLTYKSSSDMQYNLMASIPACVNRVPMINLDIDLQDDYSGGATGKTGIYAAHMNLYYGPNSGSTGKLKEVNLPEQGQFRRQYSSKAEVNSYRMWAWRQRFADGVNRKVNRKNLQLPENVNVDQIAEDYRDTGYSAGELWLSSDFLFGAEAGEPNTQTETVTRQINETCAVGVEDIEEKDFNDVEELRNYVDNNPEEAKNLLGKETGDNYCSIGEDQTLEKIWKVEDSGTEELEDTEKDGYISTKHLSNLTDVLSEDPVLNVTDMDIEHDGENVNTTDKFETYYDDQTEEAKQKIIDNKNNWETDQEIDNKKFTEVSSIEKETVYTFNFDAEYTSWMTGDYFEQELSHDGDPEHPVNNDDEVHEQLRVNNILDEDWRPDDRLKPENRFDGYYVTDVLDHSKNGSYSGEMYLEVSAPESSEYAYIDTMVIEQREAKRSWNWRALQGLSMTTLAKCMYNWDQCITDRKSLPSKSWSATEVADAGYGPWENSFTFSWSQDAAEESAQLLQEAIDDTDDYNRSIDTSFDKYYDGARGRNQRQITPVNVYKRCDQNQSWRNAEGEFYTGDHFICPDSNEANFGEADKNTVYRCDANVAQLPDYVERAEEYEARQMNDNWYVCRTFSPGKWYKDESPPEVYLSGSQGSTDTAQTAELTCEDKIATCNESSYRMKLYDPGEQPNQCPTDYSEYDVKQKSKVIGAHKYVCGAAKDLVDKEGYTPEPVEFDSSSLVAQFIYPSDQIVTSTSGAVNLFYEVGNYGEKDKDIKIELQGVNSSFTDTDLSEKTVSLQSGETKEYQLEVKPKSTGDKKLVGVSTIQDTGLEVNDTLDVSVPLNATAATDEVSGIGTVQIIVAMILASTAYLYTRMVNF